jgi:DNA/RNA endonuclease G (NUC1)
MRMPFRSAASLALVLAVGSCSDHGGLNPVGPSAANGPSLNVSAASLPLVRISEIHYDNSGTDADERIEISGPTGTDLTGWSVVLYNGSNNLAYNTRALSGTIPATCDKRGVVVLTYPVDGIQNGAPDGIALVNGSTVVEFLSYEGSMTVTYVPTGQVIQSTDIVVTEGTSTPVGHSLARNGSDVWSAPAPNTFGTCNDNDEPPPPEVQSVTVTPTAASITKGATQAFVATAYDEAQQPIAGVTFTWSSSNPAVATIDGSGIATAVEVGDAQIRAAAPNGTVSDPVELHVSEAPPTELPPIRFSEIHYDNFGTDGGEKIEIEGPAGTNLTGWTVILYNGSNNSPYSTRELSATIQAQCTGRGVTVLEYAQDGIQNGAPDGFALIDANDQVVEFLSYEGTMTVIGPSGQPITSTDLGVSQSSTPVGQSLQRTASGAWQAPSAELGSSFGTCNGSGGSQTPTRTITFTGREGSDPPLPVGFEDQLFAALRVNGEPSPTTFTWLSETPTIASIDQHGVMRALAAGTATFRATAADGITTATFTLPTRVATASTTALYAGNAEFGEPRDGDASDDFIVRYPQFTASYNGMKGIPNWVSYNIDPTHFGGEDRCDCFTFDRDRLPSDLSTYTTADYTGAGMFHGYGIDRGHLARSFDRTSGSLDNAHTFYFTNIIPQASDNNQGPWAAFEDTLGDVVRFENKEVYVIAGASGSKGTVKGEGKITIPTSTWKVAVIMPRDKGLADVDEHTDVEVIAIIVPNDAGIRNVRWETYKTTTDAVEALSGYDLLALLPDQIEIAVESNSQPPTARTNGPFPSHEGSAVAMSGATSTDPDGDALTYHWVFGDGMTGTGVAPSHTYAQNGTYTIRLTVTDSRGLTATTTTSATVANVAPTIAAFPDATLVPGETYTANGAFSDPGADSWSGTVDYGDESGISSLALSNKTFSLSHVYRAAGIFTVTVHVSDGDDARKRHQTVTVLTPVQAVSNVIDLVERLASGASAAAVTTRVAKTGRLDANDAKWLVNKLELAINHLKGARLAPAVNQLEQVVARVDALVEAGGLSPADADPLRTLVLRVIRSVTS